MVFNNRAAIGGFDESGSTPAGWYWSSTEDNLSYAWAQRFSDGTLGSNIKGHDSSLGLCGGDPPPRPVAPALERHEASAREGLNVAACAEDFLRLHRAELKIIQVHSNIS